MTGIPKVFLLGSGRHAKMVIESIRSGTNYEIVACLSSSGESAGMLLGIPVIAESDGLLRDYALKKYLGFVAMGDNRLRRTLANKLDAFSIQQPNIVSSHAYVSPSAQLDRGIVIMPGAVVGAEAILGSCCIVNTSCSIDHDCRLGAFVHIGPGCHLAGNVCVGDGAFLGVGTIVIPERCIGASTVVGAGSVVIRDIPDEETWVGTPARPIRNKSG